MREFKEIFIDAAPPYERGVQYGQLARDEIHLCIQRYREHFKAAGKISWDEARGKVLPFKELLKKDYQDCLSEVEGIAEGAEVDFDDLMVSARPSRSSGRPRRTAVCMWGRIGITARL